MGEAALGALGALGFMGVQGILGIEGARFTVIAATTGEELYPQTQHTQGVGAGSNECMPFCRCP